MPLSFWPTGKMANYTNLCFYICFMIFINLRALGIKEEAVIVFSDNAMEPSLQSNQDKKPIERMIKISTKKNKFNLMEPITVEAIVFCQKGSGITIPVRPSDYLMFNINVKDDSGKNVSFTRYYENLINKPILDMQFHNTFHRDFNLKTNIIVNLIRDMTIPGVYRVQLDFIYGDMAMFLDNRLSILSSNEITIRVLDNTGIKDK